jgi:phage FluMu protein Com
MAKTRKVGKKRNLVRKYKSRRYAKGYDKAYVKAYEEEEKTYEEAVSALLSKKLNDVHIRTYGREFADPSLVSQIVSHLVENKRAAPRKIQSRFRGQKTRKLLSRIKTTIPTDIECPICVEPMTEDVATLFPCGHRFHRACIRPALTGTERKCPVCKVNVTSILN